MISSFKLGIQALSLKKLEENESYLRTFLSDVKNIQWLRSRALRLRAWMKLNDLERHLINIVCITLTRIRSRVLMNSLVKIAKKLIPHLYTRFESRLLEYMEIIKQNLIKAAKEKKILYLLKLARNTEYIYSQALKAVATERALGEIITESV